jgi:hypothetical protein
MLKKIGICFASIALLICGSSVSAIDLGEHFTLYGFLKGDMVIQDDPVNSIFAARFAQSGVGDMATHLTAMHSRFGFKWKGAELNHGLGKVYGHLEWDFFDTSSRNQMKFRVRHAYFGMKGENHDMIFGQYWDLFSPLGPTTLNTNGYFWQTGNMGFRRAQWRFTYTQNMFDVAVSLSDPTSEEGTRKGLPPVMGRLGLKLGEEQAYKMGISFVAGQGTYRAGEGDDFMEDDVTTWGFGLDWLLKPGGGFEIKGELHGGQNLSIFLSRAGVFTDMENMTFEAVDTIAGWLQLVYKFERASVWAGFASENLRNNNEIPTGGLKDTKAFFLGMLYSLGAKTSIGVEYTFFDSKFKDADKGDCNQFQASWIYKF